MNILITGADGQVGRDLKNNFNNINFKLFFFNKKELNLFDIKKLNQIIVKINPSIIINCAAFTDVEKAETNKYNAFAINCRSVKNLALLCHLKDIYLIHFSSDFIFNGKKKKYYEEDEAIPLNFYGKSKYIGEKLIIQYMKNYLILRVSWVIGKHGNNFLKKIFNLLIESKEVKVVGDQISNPTTTDTITKVVSMCCINYFNKNKKILNGTYNLCCEPSISKYEFAKFIFNQLKAMNIIKHEINIIQTKTKDTKDIALRPLNSSLNTNKIRKKLEITEEMNWKKQIKKILTEINAQ